jgi:hypothetical protein
MSNGGEEAFKSLALNPLFSGLPDETMRLVLSWSKKISIEAKSFGP